MTGGFGEQKKKKTQHNKKADNNSAQAIHLLICDCRLVDSRFDLLSKDTNGIEKVASG